MSATVWARLPSAGGHVRGVCAFLDRPTALFGPMVAARVLAGKPCDQDRDRTRYRAPLPA